MGPEGNILVNSPITTFQQSFPRSNERDFMMPKTQISKSSCKITFLKDRTRNSHFPRPAETDPYAFSKNMTCTVHLPLPARCW